MAANILRQTPSQTVGPYFAYGLTSEQYGYPFTQLISERLADEDCAGEHVTITGQVIDGEGQAINDAMIEIVQSNTDGEFPTDLNGSFRCYGRSGTGTHEDNRFVFNTVKPTYRNEELAPHISMAVFMRGLLTHCYTRLYFSDEVERNALDKTLQSIPVDRRETLIAKRQETAEGIIYHFDIYMQGEQETVFFDL